jgi:hypothetical protein
MFAASRRSHLKWGILKRYIGWNQRIKTQDGGAIDCINRNIGFGRATLMCLSGMFCEKYVEFGLPAVKALAIMFFLNGFLTPRLQRHRSA